MSCIKIQQSAWITTALLFLVLTNILKMFYFSRYLQEWRNEFLTWNASEYGDLERVHFAPDEIWVPDIALFNK